MKVGAKVLFCTNKWGKYYNGERGIIKAIDENEVIVEKAGELIKVERQEYTLHENVVMEGEVKEKPLVSIEQFPLKLAYAITITLPRAQWMRYSLQLVKATGDNIRNLELLGLYRIPSRGVVGMSHDAKTGRLLLALNREAVGASRQPFLLARRRDDRTLVSCLLEEG